MRLSEISLNLAHMPPTPPHRFAGGGEKKQRFVGRREKNQFAVYTNSRSLRGGKNSRENTSAGVGARASW